MRGGLVALLLHECFMLASQFRFVSTSEVSLLPSVVPRRAIKGRVYCFSYCEFKVLDASALFYCL